MPTFNAPLPPTRSTGDAPPEGPAGDVNMLSTAVVEVRGQVPDAPDLTGYALLTDIPPKTALAIGPGITATPGTGVLTLAVTYPVVPMSRAAYLALATKDPDTLYITESVIYLGSNIAWSPTSSETLDGITGPVTVQRLEAVPGGGIDPAYQAAALTGTIAAERTVYAVVTPALDAAGNQSIIDASTGRSQIAFNAGNTWVAYGGGTPPQTNAGFAADKGRKVVVSARFATGSVRLYRNGALIASGTPTVGTISGELRIGARAAGFEAFTGPIHALHFFDTAHTDQVHADAAAWLAARHNVTL